LAVLAVKILGVLFVVGLIIFILVMEVQATRDDRERDRRDGYRRTE
jgi:hypothetical protein